MSKWKFGEGQSPKQERQELRAALRAGRGDEYVAGQRGRRLIEEEGERKRARKASRKTTQARGGVRR